jgi:putative transposase
MRFAWRGFGAARHRDLSFIRIGAVSIADCGHEFQNALKGYEIKSSMSRKGNCWDNAPTESLWGRLKVGRLYGRRFASRRQAMDEVIDWLTFYNYKRLHSTLGYASPMMFEQRWIAAQQQDRKSA